MPDTDIASAVSSDLAGAVDDVTVAAQVTDGATGSETTYQCSKWSEWFGLYKQVPELKAAIDLRSVWTVGKGWKSDIRSSVILDRMRGWGEDTFNAILKNMIVTKRICGDAYAEIIRDSKNTLLNLKPLDPGSMVIVADKRGMLKRYEQVSKTKGGKTIKFKPDQILHFMNKRVADEIHGQGDVAIVEDIILANNEIFFDMKKLMHRHVKPMMAFKLDTDDATKIAAFKTKMDAALADGENFYIPKDTVEFELVSVPPNATLNPIPWRNHLKEYFWQVVGVPQIIMGSASDYTESSAKIAYLAFMQSVEDEQKDIEEQIWRQLYIKIELQFPATMQNEMLSMREDEKKDAGQGVGFQPSDQAVAPPMSQQEEVAE